jgi:hypothetical protein
VVRATDGGTTVRVAGVERPFEAFVGDAGGGGPGGDGDWPPAGATDDEGTGEPADAGEVTA